MSNPDLPPDSITTLPPDSRLAAIRARLEERPCFATHELYGDRARDANGWIRQAKAAIIAVLDRHKPVHVDHPLNPNLANCSTCRDLGPEINSPAAYPCEEIEDIAKALGIGVDDGRAPV